MANSLSGDIKDVGHPRRSPRSIEDSYRLRDQENVSLGNIEETVKGLRKICMTSSISSNCSLSQVSSRILVHVQDLPVQPETREHVGYKRVCFSPG
jgi:hypothetical protein